MSTENTLKHWTEVHGALTLNFLGTDNVHAFNIYRFKGNFIISVNNRDGSPVTVNMSKEVAVAAFKELVGYLEQ